MGRKMSLDEPRAIYSRGWGPNGSDSSDVIAAWSLFMQDMMNQPVEIVFDVTNDESPIIIGMDLKKDTTTDNLTSPPRMIMKRPEDRSIRMLETYMSVTDPLQARLRLLVVPAATTAALIGEARKPERIRPMTLAKRIHNLTHASSAQATRICEEAGWLTSDLKRAIEKVSDNCPSCALSGPPAPSRKISLSHVNEGFNAEIQVDFMYFHVREGIHTALHMVDTGTGFSEVRIVQTRKAEKLIDVLDVAWIFTHGTPGSLSADDEFNREPVRKALQTRMIYFKPRPTRRHNKCGIVERKNATIKRILERLVQADEDSSPEVLVAKACFLSNCLHGTKVLSSFELARGYTPSIVGNPSRKVPSEILDVHKRQSAIRALNQLMRSRHTKLLTKMDINTGDDVAYYYNSTKGNERPEWRQGKVSRILDELVEINTGKKGPVARVAYEDLRIPPRDETMQLAERGEEGEINEQFDLYNISAGGESEDDDLILHEGQQVMGNISTIPANRVSDAFMAQVKDDQDDGRTERTKKDDRSVKDVGNYEPSRTLITGMELQSNEGDILRDIKETIGSNQVTASAIAFAPGWVIEKAIRQEHDENWTGAYSEVMESDLPNNANVISSHVVFKVKTQDDESLRMKARIVVHGNRDADKDSVRSDCASADMMLVRMVISLTTIMGFNLASADIKGAYMQSGPIRREVYVRPPRDCHRRRGVIWKLLKLPYGMTDAGRQWLLRAEDWMLGKAGMMRVDGINQLFVKRDGSTIKLIVAKVIDDFLIAGKTSDIREFLNDLSDEFEVGNTAIGGNFRFNGCEIEVGCDAIEISMWGYLEKLSPIQISRSRNKQRDERVTKEEERSYRALAGTLMYLGNSIIPQASMATSKMQQRLGNLRVKDLVEGNLVTKEMLRLRPYIRYIRPVNVTNMRLISISDASHGGADCVYGQTGGLCGLVIESEGSSEVIYHPIGWTSHKQKRVSYSAFGAEILAAADADDRGFDLKLSLRSILPNSDIRHELFVDARALFDTITTLHEPREYRLRKTVARMRDAYESGDLDCVKWIDGKVNLADALTKDNTDLSVKLNNMLASGLWYSRLCDEWRI